MDDFVALFQHVVPEGRRLHSKDREDVAWVRMQQLTGMVIELAFVARC